MHDAISLQISDNGYVTVNRPLLSTLPKPFPITKGSHISQKSVMIAPYWSDIDTRCGGANPGHIYYRQLSLIPGSDLSKKIQDDIEYGDSYEPTSVVIVTWEAVTPSNCGDKRVKYIASSPGPFPVFSRNIENWEWAWGRG